MSSIPSSQRRAWTFASSAIVLTALAILFIDRGASSWSHAEHLRQFRIFDAMTHLVDPLERGAILGLVVAGLAAALGGWRPKEGGLTLIACCLSIVVAYAIKEELKFICGRTWPETWVNGNPSWISDGVFGFNFFHGGEGWASFPSGHTTQMAALAAVLWIRLPRLRWLWVLLVVAVVVGLLGADYHWVGDMVAGGFLGVACGVGAVALLTHRFSGLQSDSAAER